ncbi:hypothetical protein [uncultured Paracoccus sp.]|uniref:hypothetical protein n=1 Tax=uncultured Paracoccus sp. TaxID=189685 RepID=UPI002610E04F|nr:hypothetical protein [uncultured Paracoccus sp.]
MAGRGAARSNWLRRFALGLLLLAIGAFVLQVPAHAGSNGHVAHNERPAAESSHCAQNALLNDHGGNASSDCAADETGAVQVECCQSCLVAAVPVAPPSFDRSVTPEVFPRLLADPFERSPEEILRPPRMLAV